ncbi:cell wall biosynthesis glycosyltransferase [Anopheles sinensis]|uniref:Cell wall biosynthesis glycosyltransferase n=1 Tax=Anopheles sinensis TaxID=74873 RepID=A0A084VW97_ANOSI|nr:cell wall biosynthesis glycosyltransferase [Anopheles sinensis]
MHTLLHHDLTEWVELNGQHRSPGRPNSTDCTRSRTIAENLSLSGADRGLESTRRLFVMTMESLYVTIKNIQPRDAIREEKL